MLEDNQQTTTFPAFNFKFKRSTEHELFVLWITSPHIPIGITAVLQCNIILSLSNVLLTCFSCALLAPLEDSLLLKTDLFLKGISLTLISPFLQSIAAISWMISEPVFRLIVTDSCPSFSGKYIQLSDGVLMVVALPDTKMSISIEHSDFSLWWWFSSTYFLSRKPDFLEIVSKPI